MDNSQALVKLDTARQALAEARTIDDLKLIRDQAQAIQNLMKTQQYSLECQNNAAEIKLRAERKLGGELVGTATKEPASSKTYETTLTELEVVCAIEFY